MLKQQNTVQIWGSLQMTEEASVGFARISKGVTKSSLKNVEYVRFHVVTAVLIIATEIFDMK
jgi:hypothetical protein